MQVKDQAVRSAVHILFAKHDPIGKGYLTFQDLRELLQTATQRQGDGHKLSDEEAKRMLKGVDKKNNGKVTPDQLQLIFKSLFK